MVGDPVGIVIDVGSFKKSPTVEIETLFTKTLLTDFTILGETHGEGGIVHVWPGDGVNTSPFAIMAILFPNTFPTGGSNVFGGVTQGHTPPLSTPL